MLVSVLIHQIKESCLVLLIRSNWSHALIEDDDPDWVLTWWKANAFNYPLMSQAVRDYFPVPSAEVGVERLFSNARDVLSIRRHCMNAETLRWLMLLKGHYDRLRDAKGKV